MQNYTGIEKGGFHTMCNIDVIRNRLRVDFENNVYPDCYLLGDGGYPCQPYLLTPLQNPGDRAEQRYNQAHIQTRNCIERAFGLWKRHFPCLSLGLHLKRDRIPPVIVATAVLRNIAIDLNDLPDVDPNIEILPAAYEGVPVVNIGNNDNRTGRALINNLFAL